MWYAAKTPWWLKKIYPTFTWGMPANEKAIYLTFDDGPHATITPTVLRHLDQYNAKATFFCIGNNVADNPDVYKDIIAQGHTVGNHTYNHLNGWKTNDEAYIKNISEAEKLISSSLFRPPYGRISKFQARLLQGNKTPYSIIMWSVLSGDFDVELSAEKCFNNVIKNTGAGDIVVFHDSEKAYQRMMYALPRTLEYFTEKGYMFKALPQGKKG